MILAGTPPYDIRLRPLKCHADERGDLHELLRLTWEDAFPVAQWNAMRSKACTLRGMSVNVRMNQFFLNAEGDALLGLADLRADSPSYRKACVIELTGKHPTEVVVPSGVAHGIYYVRDSLTLAALGAPYDARDELGCQWSDPFLAIPWPPIDPLLIERDRTWPPAEQLVDTIRHRTSGLH